MKVPKSASVSSFKQFSLQVETCGSSVISALEVMGIYAPVPWAPSVVVNFSIVNVLLINLAFDHILAELGYEFWF